MIIEFIRISFIKSNLFYRMLIISHKDEALLCLYGYDVDLHLCDSETLIHAAFLQKCFDVRFFATEVFIKCHCIFGRAA